MAALCMNYCAVAGAIVFRTPRYAQSGLTIRLGGVASALGTLAGFFAIYLFIASSGWAAGLLYWVVSSVLMILVVSALMDGLRPITGLVAFAVGLAFFVAHLRVG